MIDYSSKKRTIQKQFYQLYTKKLSLKEFEKWVYQTQEIEQVYGEDFYFTLIDIPYNDKFAREEVERLIIPKIPMSEFEQIRIMELLNALINESKDIVKVMGQLYHDYGRGYYFLSGLGIFYATSGLDEIPKLSEKENWMDKEFNLKKNLFLLLKKRRNGSFGSLKMGY